jgi:hypothetical protein
MARRATIGFLAVLIAFGLVRIAPWALQSRERIAGSPSLSGIYVANPVVLDAGETACIKPVPLTEDVAKAQVMVFTRRPQPLELSLRAPGYAASARAPANYRDDREVPVVFDLPRRPPRQAMGEACVRNIGTAPVKMSATGEPRSDAVAQTTKAGKPQPDMHLTLLSGDRSSTLRFVPTLMDRASALTGGAVPTPVVWLIALAFFLGVPAGVAYALVRSFHEPSS